jgi:four helix bundle protein
MTYTNLEAWKEARYLVKAVYVYTATFPQQEIMGLQAQIRRAAVSIPSNIADGCGRANRKDVLQCFHTAKSAIYELETELYLSHDLNFIKQDDLESLLQQTTKTRELLCGLIKYYKTELDD